MSLAALEAAGLGLVQGLTEFLPVSSSGHLVLFQRWLRPPGDPVLFDLALHLGTLVPVLWVYRADLARIAASPMREEGPLLARPGLRLGLLVCLATLPTAIVGLLFKGLLERLFATPSTLVLTFALTGTVLFATRRLPAGVQDERGFSPWRALLVGLAQGLAIAPGISRSGTTIAVALLLGASRDFSARFSFLLAIPAIAGAFVLEAGDASLSAGELPVVLAGATTAAATGYVALRLLLRVVHRGAISRFAWYCWAMAAVALAMAWLA